MKSKITSYSSCKVFALTQLCLLIAIVQPALAQNGTWTNLVSGDASGSWANIINWNNGVIATNTGNTADLSTLNITTNSTVTLDGAKTIGNITFGDTTPSAGWLLNAGTGGALTLAVTTGQPTITANNGSNIVNVVLTGNNGLVKAGSGTLRLNGADTFSSNILVNAGILQIGNNTALGITTPNGSLVLSNAVWIAPGATVQVIPTFQPNFHPTYVGGTGVGGTQGAIYADLSSQAQNQNNTRYCIGLTTAASPAVIMTNDTIIRVDGTNIDAQGSVMLIGHITTSNALTGTPINFPYTLTKTGTGRLSLDPAGGYSGGDIHVAQGALRLGNNNDILGFQTVTVDAGTRLTCGNNTSLNSPNSTIVLNDQLDIQGNGTVTVVGAQVIGYLSGSSSGYITNGTLGGTQASTLTIAGTNGSTTTFSGQIVKSATGSVGLIIRNTNSTLRLSGANTYQGVTTVNAGTLLVNGSHTNGATYTVATGATLGGSGTIYPAITLSGTLRAGDSGGTLNVSGVTGTGNLIISNANLTVSGQLNNSGSGVLSSIYFLSNTVTTFPLQGGSEASIYAATVTVDGISNKLNVLIANPVNGQFPLIGSVTSIGGAQGFSGLTLQVPSGVGAYLSNNTANSSIDIVITNVPQIVWRGTPTGDWSIGGSANWFNGAAVAYTETAGLGPFVLFDDTATGQTNVNITTTVSPRGLTANSTNKTYTLRGTGGVSGAGNWLKGGPSTLTVANSGANNFSGSVTISGGAVQLGTNGTSGDLGTASIANSGSLIFNRSDDVTFGNVISGNGSLIKQAADIVTLTGVGSGSAPITVNSGTLALAPSGTITLSGNVTGGGTFGETGAGTIILTSGTITYGGGTVISNGILQFNNVLPPSGSISDNGTLALALGGTLGNIVSGSGGISIINNATVTLTGANTYSGPTTVLSSDGSGSVNATASTYPSTSVLRLGSQTGTNFIGTANFTAGNPVIGGLQIGGDDAGGPFNAVNLPAGNQTLTINGNLSVGNIGPVGATIVPTFTGTGVSIVVNTNGGTVQIGLGATGSGVNPDNIGVDLSTIDKFIVNLGTTGLVNLGTIDQNPGPPTGASVLNQFILASISNRITAGSINVGAGGRQLTPELMLGAGTNILNVDALNVGTGGRDGGYLHFAGGTGGVRLRANDGVSRASMNVGVNTVSGTGANVQNTVDLTGHPADLFLGTLVIGNYPIRVGTNFFNIFSFDQGILDATSVSMGVGHLNNAQPCLNTLSIGGGTASLGPVSLTTSVVPGTLNISSASVTVSNITSAGTGAAELDIANSTLNLALGASSNPVTAPVVVDNFNPSGTVNLGFAGSGFTVGQFPLISYAGSIGGGGFATLNLTSLPIGVGGYLSNNVAALSVDVVITNAPPVINSNPTNIIALVNNGKLELSWPPDHTGWHLQAQTNSLVNGLGTNWVTIPGTDANNHYTNTIDATKPTVFYRMIYP